VDGGQWSVSSDLEKYPENRQQILWEINMKMIGWDRKNLSVMDKVRNYRDLIVWQKAMNMVKDIYLDVAGFPKAELYGLTSQIRRSAVSVPANIAEGQARNSTGEFRQFLGVSKGSLAELETLLLLSTNLGFLGKEKSTSLLDQCAELNRLINGLLRSLPR
jgi:four helix bundle protein